MKPSHEPNPSIEWLCACLTIPPQLFDPTQQADPLESLVWMIPDGPVLGSLTLESDQTPVEMVVEHFRHTTQSPLVGEPHQPTRIRVADDELAAALRDALSPAIEVVCAPTPEFDTLLQSMTEFMQQQRPETPSYLSADVTEDVVAAFFRAAAALYVARPWTSLPADAPILLDVEALSLTGAALVVMGHGNQQFGFLLFACEADFRGFLHAAKRGRPNAHAPMPLFALDYSRGADLPVELRKEVTVHAWQVADANAYPALTILANAPSTGQQQFAGGPPTAAQMHQAEAISLALADFAQARVVARATGEPPPTSSIETVATHTGPIQVKLTLASAPTCLPHEHRPSTASARPRAKWKKKRKQT
jgi:hypothetical protein